MSLEIAWKQNILVTDSNLLKSLPVVFGFGSQAFICGFSRQNICSVGLLIHYGSRVSKRFSHEIQEMKGEANGTLGAHCTFCMKLIVPSSKCSFIPYGVSQIGIW